MTVGAGVIEGEGVEGVGDGRSEGEGVGSEDGGGLGMGEGQGVGTSVGGEVGALVGDGERKERCLNSKLRQPMNPISNKISHAVSMIITVTARSHNNAANSEVLSLFI